MNAAPDDASPELLPQPQYHAYLIRLWRDGEQTPWRASVTHVATGEVHRFADAQQAWAYILAGLTSTFGPPDRATDFGKGVSEHGNS